MSRLYHDAGGLSCGNRSQQETAAGHEVPQHPGLHVQTCGAEVLADLLRPRHRAASPPATPPEGGAPMRWPPSPAWLPLVLPLLFGRLHIDDAALTSAAVTIA